MIQRLLSAALTLGVLCVAVAAPALAGSAIGDDGRLFVVHEGLYLELFPGGNHGVAGWNPVLRMDVTAANGVTERILVPGTEGIEIDSHASIAHDRGKTFLLWAAEVDRERSSLHLITFDGENFGPIREVSGDPLRLKGKPQIVATRDSVQRGPENVHRTALHTLWWEEGDDTVNVFYSPIVLLDGEYLGTNPVVHLDLLDKRPVAATPSSVALDRAATLERGGDDLSVVLTVAHSESRRLQTLQVRLLPDELQRLADDVRAHIVGVGFTLMQQGGPPAVADAARSHIVGIGRVQLHPGVRKYIADQTFGVLSELEPGGIGPNEIEALARSAWREVLESGASILGHGTLNGGRACAITPLDGSAAAPEQADHHVELCVVTDRSAPTTAATGYHYLTASEDGHDVLVAWQVGPQRLRFRTTVGHGWTQPREVLVPVTTGLEEAVTALQRRVRPW